MLVLTRKVQEKIQIGQNITVTVVRVKGKAVRLGIEAPESVRISRGELGSATPQQAAHPGRAASPVTAPTAPRSAAAKSGTEPAAADGDASTHPRPESDAGDGGTVKLRQTARFRAGASSAAPFCGRRFRFLPAAGRQAANGLARFAGESGCAL